MSDEADTDTSPEPAGEEMEITCAAQCDISVAQELYAQLRPSLDAGRSVVLNAGQVERADTAALQLLCALFQDAEAKGLSIGWRDPSPDLRRAARQLGLTDHLRLAAD